MEGESYAMSGRRSPFKEKRGPANFMKRNPLSTERGGQVGHGKINDMQGPAWRRKINGQ